MESTKKVKICGVEYDMRSSVLTQANFKNIFGMEEDFADTYFKVMEAMKKAKQQKPKELTDEEKENLSEIEKSERQLATLKSMTTIYSIIPDALKLAYAMIYEVDNYFMPYNDWLSTLVGVMEEPSWLYEVVGIASYVFRRVLQEQNTKG